MIERVSAVSPSCLKPPEAPLYLQEHSWNVWNDHETAWNIPEIAGTLLKPHENP